MSSVLIIGSSSAVYAVDEHTKCSSMILAVVSKDVELLHSFGEFFRTEFEGFDKVLSEEGKPELMGVMNDERSRVIIGAMYNVCKLHTDYNMESIAIGGYYTARLKYMRIN